ncbi:hypothetical protein ACQ856_18110 [Mycolicibacterium psychrotolerans]|uniref:hypothetical protein n=1 Tax=Mycolicibacterium psychrotolerans TaxID=216929 RepID=UPI003D67CA3B
MSWDGTPDGWTPPGEQRAADEAAAKFEAERAAADTRTRTLADAISFGLDRIALAIVAAGGRAAADLFEQLNAPDLLTAEALAELNPQPVRDAMLARARADAESEDDPELDDLLNPDD